MVAGPAPPLAAVRVLKMLQPQPVAVDARVPEEAVLRVLTLEFVLLMHS